VPQLKVPQFILIDCGKRLSNAVPYVRAPISLHKSSQSEYMPNTLKQKQYLIKKAQITKPDADLLHTATEKLQLLKTKLVEFQKIKKSSGDGT
jgi:hypothetical protein